MTIPKSMTSIKWDIDYEDYNLYEARHFIFSNVAVHRHLQNTTYREFFETF